VNITIQNIVKPIIMNKNEKMIFVVGDKDNIPPKDVFERICKDLDGIGDANQIVIPYPIFKVYIVPKDSEIELYRGDKLDEEKN